MFLHQKLLSRKGADGTSLFSLADTAVLSNKKRALDKSRARFFSACKIRGDQAFLAISVSWVKAAASLTAISASIFRLISMPATFRPCMKLE